ncbi:uncharacterized protein LOC129605372 isoform X2 [Condylostylus longicornis]|uniref:uncharacterized protein LOC129605372 isoform X2 n=1 Tax=Condylostylus longicornis TaxID=2530218 RepID=UPI00244DAEB4|nr:uncharacterized protein LOC129605372 isoform X2 [Condylostylus longicornis]
MEQQPLIVQAEFPFRGDNNDELCFKKGDIITVTQREEGGWWEGTLNDKTGWFPSNYVKEYKAALPISETIRPPEEIQEYRSVVLKDLLESEKAHVAEITGLLENFLEPLQTSQILNNDEYAQLMCNFIEVVETHDNLYRCLEECNDRVGKLFLNKAPVMKSVHQAYCAAHPRAIVILDKYKDELEKFMERQGAASPGLLVLTTGLSKPFRRLDKYSAMLQELERHMESSHPDRGDTQRSVAVYKDIAATCSATRRQKELELQVLTGPVRGWQGQELSTLGDIIHMGSVAVGPDHRDRYFVLFPQTLLILSVSQRMSAFIYEGKLPLTGIEVRRLDDTELIKNAFEVCGPLIEKIVAVCQGPNEANKWVELLTSANPQTMPINIKRNVSSGAISNVPPLAPPHMSPPANLGMINQQQQSTLRSQQQQQQPLINQTSQHKRSLSFNHHLSYNQYSTLSNQQHPQLHQHQQQQPIHQGIGLGQGAAVVTQVTTVTPVQNQNLKSNLVQTSKNISKLENPMHNHPVVVGTGITKTPPTVVGQSGRIGNIKANWSITNLQPAPPLRPNLLNPPPPTSSSGGSSVNTLTNYCNSRKVQPTYEEDALVLRVIEAYCAAYQSNSRNTIHSALQPWTPCLPIRGGKLQTTRAFSTSNPQLPFLCSGPSYEQPLSNNSLNSSYIWREASPNNFNMYSASVSSLNTAYRYSLGGANTTGPTVISGGGSGVGGIVSGGIITSTGSTGYSRRISDFNRSASEERHPQASQHQHHLQYLQPQTHQQRKNFMNAYRFKTGSGYDNIFMTPLLPRKNKQSKGIKSSYQTHQRTPPPPTPPLSLSRKNSLENRLPPVASTSSIGAVPAPGLHPGLYDRRLNRSFEAPQGYLKTSSLRRSTPHLPGEDECMPTSIIGNNNHSHEHDRDSRHSAIQCCGNFVMKQWRKINHHY